MRFQRVVSGMNLHSFVHLLLFVLDVVLVWDGPDVEIYIDFNHVVTKTK